MTTTSGVNSNSNAAGASLLSSASSSSDIQNNFLKMLVTQMKNQDPLKPMDNAQLTSQLAQISTVSSMEIMNATMTQLLAQVSASRAMDSAALIGRTVMVPGNGVEVVEGKASQFGIDLPSTADAVTVEVLDEKGNVVRSIDMKGRTAGVHDVAWDGKNDAGGAVPDGEYTFRVVATADGKAINGASLIYGKVQAISGDANGVLVDLGEGRTALVDDVRRIL
ncbi:flagellar hook assembly protein FlgD [Cupriavidus sp. AU9028]|uniref:flagellar hook assembly protein FlgD n=1 Tax=Cupriavidus sp. AU9028 TaxID=2871157 RepID=UPI001C944A7C|nr:flagellar hook assembly protein FlgD [Cupriavidus sp. AU9028]MBY4898453.1 flagellar hook assembly protein FlgD [Cupriavidus sp. AU9028]